MFTPKKTLIVEKISYAEEGLKHIRRELRSLIDDVDIEYQRIIQELEILEAREGEITEQTFNSINDLLQDAWMRAMSARNRLKDLDVDFHECDELMTKTINELEKSMKP